MPSGRATCGVGTVARRRRKGTPLAHSKHSSVPKTYTADYSLRRGIAALRRADAELTANYEYHEGTYLETGRESALEQCHKAIKYGTAVSAALKILLPVAPRRGGRPRGSGKPKKVEGVG